MIANAAGKRDRRLHITALFVLIVCFVCWLLLSFLCTLPSSLPLHGATSLFPLHWAPLPFSRSLMHSTFPLFSETFFSCLSCLCYQHRILFLSLSSAALFLPLQTFLGATGSQASAHTTTRSFTGAAYFSSSRRHTQIHIQTYRFSFYFIYMSCTLIFS